MKMTISRFFIRLKLFLQIATVTLLLFVSSFSTRADVGLTFELKQERAALISEINELKRDSVFDTYKLDSLQQAVIDVDSQILSSYDETVDRMAGNARERAGNSQFAVFVALIASVIALFLFALLFMASNRVKEQVGENLIDVIQHLFSDLVHSVSAEKASMQKLLRVNTVVIAGLIFMSISIVAYLLRNL